MTRRLFFFLCCLSILLTGCEHKHPEGLHQPGALLSLGSIKSDKDVRKALDMAYRDFMEFKNIYYCSEHGFDRIDYSKDSYYSQWIDYLDSLSQMQCYKDFDSKYYYFSDYTLTELASDYVKYRKNPKLLFYKEDYMNRVSYIESYIKDRLAPRKTEIPTTKEKQIVRTVVGIWEINNSIAVQAGYRLEIYKEEGMYYAKEGYSDSKKLTKKGNRYYIDESPTGDYYKINGHNLRLCDSEGDFTASSGYDVTYMGK